MTISKEMIKEIVNEVLNEGFKYGEYTYKGQEERRDAANALDLSKMKKGNKYVLILKTISLLNDAGELANKKIVNIANGMKPTSFGSYYSKLVYNNYIISKDRQGYFITDKGLGAIK